ncbi:MAG TPA: hypothetical protein VMT55_04370 [Candidatus Sulfotelmatobacter sp.]|nr:hypothetical protein [Candidatus Sulfotelmatobacter sp.]
MFYNLTFSNAAKKNLASGTVTVGGDLSVTSGTADASVNNSSVTVTGNVTGTGPIKSGSGTISLAGNWTNSGTFTCGTGKVVYSKTTGGQTVGGLTYNNLSLSDTSGTDTAGGNIIVNGILTTEAGGTLDLTSAYTLGGTLATITNNGAIKTSVPTATSAVPLAAGETWSGNGTVEYAAATAQSIVKGTYHDLTFSGAGAKTITSETVTVGGDLSVTSGTADASVNNSTIDVTGNFTGTGPVKIGSGALSLGGNWSNSGTFTAGTGTVTLDGTGQQTISTALTGSSALYNLTITNASGTDDPGDGVSFTPGVIFSTSETSTNNFTITTPSVRVQYNSGSTYTFNNINWNGGAASTNIFFRNSNLSSGTWLLNVSGTQTAVSFVNVARSDASSPGSTINANDGTCYDAKNNINWFWGANPGFFNVFE